MGTRFERTTMTTTPVATTESAAIEAGGEFIRPNGEACAALVAAGIGSAVLGLIIPISEAIPPLKTSLNWLSPVGSLSGKTGVMVIAWLIAWVVLHFLWKDTQRSLRTVIITTIILLGIGLLGSFPPFFEMFTAH